MLSGHDPLQPYRQREKCEIERPNAQNSPDVKRAQIQRSHQIFLAQQQLGDQVGTEYEEQAHAERTRRADSRYKTRQERRQAKLRPKRRIMRKRVMQEHHQEGEKTELVQFRMVETRGGSASALQNASFGTGCSYRSQY